MKANLYFSFPPSHPYLFSDAEFVSKIDLCAQEADETCLWLELLQDDCSIKTDDLNWLLKESNELIAIFVTMSKNVKKRVKR